MLTDGPLRRAVSDRKSGFICVLHQRFLGHYRSWNRQPFPVTRLAFPSSSGLLPLFIFKSPPPRLGLNLSNCYRFDYLEKYLHFFYFLKKKPLIKKANLWYRPSSGQSLSSGSFLFFLCLHKLFLQLNLRSAPFCFYSMSFSWFLKTAWGS